MKFCSKVVGCCFLLFVLAACGPKDVQPIQSLSNVGTNEMRIANVDVQMGKSFAEFYAKEISDEAKIIEDQNARIGRLSVSQSRRNRLATEDAERIIAEAERKKGRLQDESRAIPVDVKASIEDVLADKFNGMRPVNLDVSVDSLTLTNGAAVFLLGGSDAMTGTLKVSDAQSSELLGEYHITNFDSNGGMIGVMARGTNVRDQIIKEFSEKVSGILAGEYVDE